jgi:hypothetical protein
MMQRSFWLFVLASGLRPHAFLQLQEDADARQDPVATVAAATNVTNGTNVTNATNGTNATTVPALNDAEILWPRLVADVQRTELKVNRLRARMAKLNARIDDVLNRTGNTQPIVLAFKDRAVVTGTSAQQNNFTIRSVKPKLDATYPAFAAEQAELGKDWADLKHDDEALKGANPEGLGYMSGNLTIFEVELDNVVPQIEAFQEVQKPSEAFLKESHPVIIRRAVDSALNDFLGDTLAGMATRLGSTSGELHTE